MRRFLIIAGLALAALAPLALIGCENMASSEEEPLSGDRASDYIRLQGVVYAPLDWDFNSNTFNAKVQHKQDTPYGYDYYENWDWDYIRSEPIQTIYTPDGGYTVWFFKAEGQVFMPGTDLYFDDLSPDSGSLPGAPRKTIVEVNRPGAQPGQTIYDSDWSYNPPNPEWPDPHFKYAPYDNPEYHHWNGWEGIVLDLR